MFKHEAKGDFNIARSTGLGVGTAVKVFDRDLTLVAKFVGDTDEVAYQIFINGCGHAGNRSVFDMDTGFFIVGTREQMEPTINETMLQNSINGRDILTGTSEIGQRIIERFTGDTLDSVRTAD